MNAATGITLDQTGQFVHLENSKPLGIVAKKSRGRWQYRDVDTKKLYASGMEPAAFAKKFWLRDDYVEPTR